MSTKIRRIKIAAALVFAVCLTIVLLAPSPVVPATVCKAYNNGVLTTDDFSGIEQAIIDDAYQTAAGLFGDNRQKCDDFVGQLLAAYLEAQDKDIVVIFNTGGWGWDSIKDSPGWTSMMHGIGEALDEMGLSYLVLDHKRTTHDLNGCVSEFMLAVGYYPSKAEDLAARIDFLTRHLPQTSIVLAGESNGAGFCYNAMCLLPDNQQVYSIQVGPPCWSSSASSERSLVLRSNGSTPDSFSQGDLFTIIRSNFEAVLGISQEHPGNILFYIGAPGHDYGWQYEEVRLQITDFLYQNFSP